MRSRAPRPLRMAAGPHRLPAQGFTLLEMLLALGLSTLIMVAAFGAIDLYWHYSSAGQEQMERSQLARSIFREFSSDIRSVVFREARLDAAATTATDSAGTETTDGTGTGTTAPEDLPGETMEPMDPAAAYTGTSVGVYGDSQMLVLHISRPSRDLDYSVPSDTLGISVRRSDLQSVSYFLSVAGGGGLQGAVGNLAAGGSVNFSRESGLQGLARLEGDRLTMDMADQEADLETLAANTKLLAEEVDFLQFRYFDGFAWYDAWDSATAGSLPQAIEVTIGLRPPQEDVTDAFESVGVSAESELFRMVVALPLAKPFVSQVGY